MLNKTKIIETLEALDSKYYSQADKASREIIQQLVINRIVMEQLNGRLETETKNTFNRIKNQWMDFVTSTSEPAQFIINSKNLERELSKNSLSARQSLNDSTSSTESLLKNRNFNLDLLNNVIIAYAFSFQNLDINLISVDVISYKKLKGSSLWFMIKKLLLRDLKPFVFLSKRELGYGIEYMIYENTLFLWKTYP